MNLSVATTSILNEKAAKRNVKKIAKAPYEIQIAIFQETLSDLESYLDTSDLRKLTSKSLGIIRDDILEIIKGVRDMRSKVSLGTINSIDGTLEELRMTRDFIQVALGMFDLFGQFNESKSKKLLAEMRSARKHIENALVLFKPVSY